MPPLAEHPTIERARAFLFPRPSEVPGGEAPAAGRITAALEHTGALLWHARTGAALGVLTSILWALTSDPGYFWPIWVWFSVGVSVSLHWVLWRSTILARPYMAAPEAPHAWLEVALAYKLPLMAWSAGVMGVIWVLDGGGYFWPRWPWFGLAFTAAVELSLREAARKRHREEREQVLAARVGELQRTRRGALEEQAAQLRRVERDLHDGAQSRLVALSMNLGRAEEKLADRPEVAELVRAAREEASAAIKELRDLARGIAPPVLADRGLEAAARSLASRSPGPVEVEADLASRPAPVIETAAYFVIAESLTNAAKHAPGAAVRVAIAGDDDELRVRIADQGPGGADPAGSGLAGLRNRVEALDGKLSVVSEAGKGTTIEAVLPCVS